MNKDLDEEFRPNRTVCDYWTFNNDKPSTEDELGEIRVDLRNWSATNKIPCEFNSTTNGFQVTIHHFCANGQSIGTALFRDLANSTFRKLDRSIFYNIR